MTKTRKCRRSVGAAVLALLAAAPIAGPAQALPPASDESAHRASTPGGSTRNEPSVAVDPRDPQVVVTAANDAEHSGVAAYWSADGGQSFTVRTALPAAGDARFGADPHLAFDGQRRLFAAYLSYGPGPDTGGVVVSRSDDGGRSWPTPPVVVARNSRTGERCAFQDFPALAVDRQRGIVYVAWQQNTLVLGDQCVPGPVQPVLVARSRDGGRTWSRPVRVPELPGESGYLPTLAVGPDGSLYVTYDSSAFEASATPACPSSVPLRVVVARSTDQGASFSASTSHSGCSVGTPLPGLSSYTGATWRIPSSSNTVVDPRTGVLVTVAALQSPAGRQYLAVQASHDRGRTWSPRAAPQDLPVAEQQMPRLAVGGDGRMSLLWQAQLPGGLLWPSHAWSLDDGRTWTATERLTDIPSNRGGPEAQVFLGDYLGNDVGTDGRAHPVWTDPREVDLDQSGGTIWTRAVAP